MKHQSPKLGRALLAALLAPEWREDVAGDLEERFAQDVQKNGLTRARLRYWLELLGFMKWRFVRRRKHDLHQSNFFLSHDMIRNYFKITFRNLAKDRGYSLINIGGLALGMSVALLIGLWMYDEMSFNRYHKHHDRLGQLWQFVKFDTEKSSYNVMPIPLAGELKAKYPDFEQISLAKGSNPILAAGETKLQRTGRYVEPAFVDMFSIEMLSGSSVSLADPNTILLAESFAKELFGHANPVDKLVRINSKTDVRVAGIYRDLPANSDFADMQFLAPWALFVTTDPGAKNSIDEWDENNYEIYVQLREHADYDVVSAKIREIRMQQDDPPKYHPEFFIHPMRKWHLYSDFENGVNVGGKIQFVWLFGTIGVFVLVLACINFMNLSTARSSKRAREVGIRKAVGSLRLQLVGQFFSESVVVVLIAFVLALLLSALLMPLFNDIAGKQMRIPWTKPAFWLAGGAFSLLTAVLAGSYPAIFLSSFQPIRVLKGSGAGNISLGRFAAVPRKVLVVVQFVVSVTLIIGTVVIYRQIQFAKNRPVGYTREGLIEVNMNTPDLHGHYDALRADLIQSGGAAEMSESSGSVTVQYGGVTDLAWKGKDPTTAPLIMSNFVTDEYGKTIGWKLLQGRDFSREFRSDTAAMILNESAVKLMGMARPLESFVRRNGRDFRIIGVVRDMVRESPFSSVSPAFYALNRGGVSTINIRLTPQLPASDALARIEKVFKKYNPTSPFLYHFVDEQYAKKFGDEERISKLATAFSVLAIFISCLGLFGLSSFVAEQRKKEIGIRKTLGASVQDLWQMLSKDFVLLVVIACVIAVPIAWYFMNDWLKVYTYRTDLSWWIFGCAMFGALAVTLLTVSFQAIRAALVDPVKSLKSE